MKRIFPSILVDDIVSVQPMALPSGLIFYMDYTYQLSYFSQLFRSNENALNANQDTLFLFFPILMKNEHNEFNRYSILISDIYKDDFDLYYYSYASSVDIKSILK